MTRPAWIPEWIPNWVLVVGVLYVAWKVFAHILAAFLRVLLPRNK